MERSTRDVDAPAAAPDDVGVVRRLDGDVRPRIEAQAVFHDGIGPPQLQHHAGPHFRLVEVLGAASQTVDLDQIAADRLSQRLEVRNRRHDLQLAGRLCVRPEHARRGDDRQDQQHQPSHASLSS
jgi:hypothetical protein